MWIKQRNRTCENMLEKWAEPFSTFASLIVDSNSSFIFHPSSLVHQAWRLLMENHPHDSICGCSIDQVHDEMRPRFDQVEQIGEEIAKQSLEALAGTIKTTSNQLSVTSDQSAIVVFNPLSSPRTDVVTTEISLPSGVSGFEIIDEAGNVIPHQSASGKTTDLINVRVRREELGGMLGMVNDGRAGNLAIQDLRFERVGTDLRVEAIFAENASPRLDVWKHGVKAFQDYINDTSIEAFHIHARSPESASITFCAVDVPGLGWKTFYVRGKESLPAEIHGTPLMHLLAPLAKLPVVQKFLASLAQPKAKPPYIIENDLFSVELNNNRTLTVTDKSTGKIYHGMNRFVDSGDCGDEYNFSPPPADLRLDSPALRGAAITRGPVQQTMTVSLGLNVPAGLSTDRKSRSNEMVNLPITTTITLTNGVPRVDIHTHVDNRAMDHRLRVHFPAPFAVDSANYDGHFEIVKRPTGVPTFDSTWAEEPRPETHQRAFTSVTDGTTSLTVANRGLPEVEVIRTPFSLTPQGRSAGKRGSEETAEIAVTLLRCVGWLSRDDFSTRKSHAGPFLETPSAQMIGEWAFEYSIIVGRNDIPPYQQAWNFESPLRAAGTDIHAGTLPASGSFISVDNSSFIISAVKETDDGRGWIVRGYNIGDEEISISLTPWRRFKKAERANMAEEKVGRLKVESSGGVAVKARGHEVVTVMFSK
jgi:alpha-mannosidase